MDALLGKLPFLFLRLLADCRKRSRKGIRGYLDRSRDGISAFFVCLFVFLGPNPWHMEVPRLRVELELHDLHHSHNNARSKPRLRPTYTTAHGNVGSLTHWARPAIEPISSWIQIGFLTTVPRRELPTFFTSWYPEMIYANHWNYFVRSQILSKCSNSPWHLLTKMSMCKAQRSLSSMVREHPQGLPAHWSPFLGTSYREKERWAPASLTLPHSPSPTWNL